MKDYTEATYGDRIAEIYDRMFAGDADVVVRTLAQLAGVGRALELGIGTGRVALPLAERGVEVHGIDASEAMVNQLRAKPGGDAIPVSIGDFADFRVDGSFALVFVVFNTIFGLTTQEAQVQCFRCVAEHLTAGGVFLNEAFVPDPALRPRAERERNQRRIRLGDPGCGPPRRGQPARVLPAPAVRRVGEPGSTRCSSATPGPPSWT